MPLYVVKLHFSIGIPMRVKNIVRQNSGLIDPKMESIFHQFQPQFGR